MPEAEIIAIGTELLLGEIQDSNSRYIAGKLRDAGIDLHRITIVGDNAQRIAKTIQEALSRADIVITCGGLGPTIDDPTREAVALAGHVELEFNPALWDQIQARFERMNRKVTENNRRQAYIPKGSLPVENPVGTAPSFITEINGHRVISLPGVPHEMEYLLENKILPFLADQYKQPFVILKTVLHVSGLGESVVDDLVADLEKLSNPTVGLAAHSGQTDVRVTAKAESHIEATRLIADVVSQIKARLGENIYGENETQLSDVVISQLKEQGLNLQLIEFGFQGQLISFLSSQGLTGIMTESRSELLPLNLLIDKVSSIRLEKQGCTLGVSLIRVANTRHLAMVLKTTHDVFRSGKDLR